MGAVYKAKQLALDRLVALKILPSDKLDLVNIQTRFHREAKTLASLSHPNIVGINDFGEEEGIYFFVMEYVDGMDLHNYIAEKKPGMEEVRNIFSQVCDALDYAHSKGVVHRDIKPANILVDRDGKVKVADFGLAKFSRPDRDTLLTSTGQMMGTANFMAPEQMTDALTVDHRADLYSLGIMLYQMLTGEIPVGKVHPPSAVSPELAAFDSIIDRALEKKPESRYQNASDLKLDVEHATRGVAPGARRKRRILHLVAIVLFACLAGGYLLYREIGEKKIDTPPPGPGVRSNLLDEFRKATAYASFSGMTSEVLAEVRALTLGLDPSERNKALLVLRNEVSSLENTWPEEEWLSRKKEAERRRQYCEFISGILPAEDGTFDPILAELDQVSKDMGAVIAWRGVIDLKIIPSPYAEVLGLKVGEEWWKVEGKRVGEGLHSPVTLRNIPIRSYTLVLSHPQKGTQEVAIAGEELENGKVYAVSGKMGAVRLGVAP